MKNPLLFLFLFFFKISLFSQESLKDKSIPELKEEISKAVSNEDYKKASEIKEIISLKEQITKAVANENYALASDLKNQILAIENGNSSNNLSTTSASIKQTRKADNVPQIDFINTVYLWNKSKNSKEDLEFGKPNISAKGGGFAFYAEATSFYELSGKSNVEIKQGQTFIVKVAEGINPVEQIKFNSLDIIDGSRYLPLYTVSTTAFYGSNSNTKQNTRNELQIKFKSLNGGYYEIILEDILLPGEYAFQVADKMYAFKVKDWYSNNGIDFRRSSIPEKEIYKTRSMTYLGLNFSLIKYNTDAEELTSELIERWVKRIKSSDPWSVGQVRSWLNKRSVLDEREFGFRKKYLYDIGNFDGPIIVNIQSTLEEYPRGEGLGLVFFAEQVDNVKRDYNSSGYFVWVDRSDNTIIDIYRLPKMKKKNHIGDVYDNAFRYYLSKYYMKNLKKFR